MHKKLYISALAGLVLVAAAAVAAPAFAASNARMWNGPEGGNRGMGAPAVFGKVTAVSGTTLTVTQNARPDEATSAAAATVYSVNASNAKVYKGGVTSTVPVSSVAVGDTVMVQGTVSGTSVTATAIHDGVGNAMGRPWTGAMEGRGASATERMTPPIQGNGEPVVAGVVTAMNGTSITITNTSNVTYAIDAASTTIVKNGTSTTIANIATGDNLVVQGTVNGTAVTAASIIDQGARPANGSADASSTAPHGGRGFFGGVGDFFGSIGGFFQHLFGF